MELSSASTSIPSWRGQENLSEWTYRVIQRQIYIDGELYLPRCVTFVNACCWQNFLCTVSSMATGTSPSKLPTSSFPPISAMSIYRIFIQDRSLGKTKLRINANNVCVILYFEIRYVGSVAAAFPSAFSRIWLSSTQHIRLKQFGNANST